MAGRRFTRPRTKVYDYNYNLGENYYRSALDGLDRKYGTLPVETLEAPKRPERPASMGNLDSLLVEERKQMDTESLNREMEEEMQSMKRISRARARPQPSSEEDFENTFHSRREEVKKRFSEKMLESVGLNSSSLQEDSSNMKQRRAARKLLVTEESVKLPVSKWSAMTDHPEDQIDEWATKSRARLSKSRLADIENEMEEIAARGAQRERRLAGLRELLSSDSSHQEQQQSSLRMRKTVVTTTEKRVI